MSTHRYWSIETYLNNGSTFPGVASWELRSAIGGADAATGGTPSASSTSAGSAAAAFDGNSSTEWVGGALTSNLFYLFPAPINILEIAVRLPASAANVPSSIVLRWSDDATNWHRVAPALQLEPSQAGSVITLSGFFDSAIGSARGRRAGQQPLSPLGAIGFVVRNQRATYDPIDGGPYRVAGDVAIDGSPATPVQRRVRLLERKTARLVREVWSDPTTGAFAFERIAMNEYIVLTDDYTRFYNAVVADAVVPVP